VVTLDPAEVVATALDGLIAGEAEILADEEPARSRPNSPSPPEIRYADFIL
jgi:hypothetical protein